MKKITLTLAQIQAHPKYFKIKKGVPVPESMTSTMSPENKELLMFFSNLKITTPEMKAEEIESVPVTPQQLKDLEYIFKLVKKNKIALKVRTEKDEKGIEVTPPLFRVWRVPFVPRGKKSGDQKDNVEQNSDLNFLKDDNDKGEE